MTKIPIREGKPFHTEPLGVELTPPSKTALHLKAAYIHSLTEAEDSSEDIMALLDVVDHRMAEKLKDAVLQVGTPVELYAGHLHLIENDPDV